MRKRSLLSRCPTYFRGLTHSALVTAVNYNTNNYLFSALFGNVENF